jgi:antitoxin component of MazEF toxin-antitoxin module
MPVVKRVVRVGNSMGVIIDKAVADIAGIEIGSEATIELEHGVVVIRVGPAKKRHSFSG